MWFVGFLPVFGRVFGGIWDGFGAVFSEMHGGGYQESLGIHSGFFHLFIIKHEFRHVFVFLSEFTEPALAAHRLTFLAYF